MKIGLHKITLSILINKSIEFFFLICIKTSENSVNKEVWGIFGIILVLHKLCILYLFIEQAKSFIHFRKKFKKNKWLLHWPLLRSLTMTRLRYQLGEDPTLLCQIWTFQIFPILSGSLYKRKTNEKHVVCVKSMQNLYILVGNQTLIQMQALLGALTIGIHCQHLRN